MIFDANGNPMPQSWASGGPLIVGDPSGRVGLQCSFGKTTRGNGDAAGQMYTVTFQVNGSGFPEARVSFGVAGNTTVRRISVANGMSLSGPASSIIVDCFDNAPVGEFTTGEQYNLSILCAPGTRGGSMQVPSLILRDAANQVLSNVLAASGNAFAIPTDAGGIAVNFTAARAGAPLAVGDLSVIQRRGVTALKAYDPLLFGQWVPLVPGADNVLVFNHSANAIPVGVVLGVDG